MFVWMVRDPSHSPAMFGGLEKGFKSGLKNIMPVAIVTRAASTPTMITSVLMTRRIAVIPVLPTP